MTIEYLKNYQAWLEKQIKELEMDIKTAPEGTLRISKNQNRTRWQVSMPSGTRKYLPKKEIDTASALARKAYNKKRMVFLRKELQALNGYLRKQEALNDYSYDLLTGSDEFAMLLRRSMMKDYGGIAENHGKFETGDQEKSGSDYYERRMLEDYERWMTEEYEKSQLHPEHLTVKTVNGLYVRSKSEAFIAAELAANGIPFRYECKLDIEGMAFYPDFTIKHPYTGEVFLWEHLGMLDDNHYLDTALSKTRVYIKNGYIPMVNLILTYETNEKPLDFSLVRGLISIFFK